VINELASQCKAIEKMAEMIYGQIMFENRCKRGGNRGMIGAFSQ